MNDRYFSIEDLPLEFNALNFGKKVAGGGYSNLYSPAPQWKGSNDELLLITTEEFKIPYLKDLYSLYDFKIKDIGSPIKNIYGCSVPRLNSVRFMDNDIIDAFDYINDLFIDENFSKDHEFENSISSIFHSYFLDNELYFSPSANKIYEAISNAFYILSRMKDDFYYRLDLHDEQFCYINNEIICIDPVIFE